jgi:hypothetical protein
VHHGNLHALLHQAIGRLETEQAAADDHGPLVVARRGQHGVHVMDVAERNHAVPVLAGHRDDERVGASGQQQAVVVCAGAVVRDDLAFHAIDRSDGLALVKVDVVVDVPLLVVEHDVIDGLFAGQQRGEHDAVVVAVGFGAKHGDVVVVRCQFQQFLQCAYAGHAVAHQHEFFLHGYYLSPVSCNYRPVLQALYQHSNGAWQTRYLTETTALKDRG